MSVTVVGSFAVGVTLRADRMPAAGETLLASGFDEGPGGKGSNQAVQVARMGVKAELVALLGHDRLAEMARELYRREGVGTAHLATTASAPSGFGVILLDGHGENRIVLSQGANAELSADHVRAAERTIRDSAVLLGQLEIPDAAVLAALELARAAGVTTILNPAPARTLGAGILRLVDLLTPNQSEARLLTGRDPASDADDEAIARELLELGVGTVVMTCGAGGALLVSHAGAVRVPAPPVEVVDSTGAGDAFNGTLAAALAAGHDLAAAVERAVRAGAWACTRLGVVPGLPRAADLDEAPG